MLTIKARDWIPGNFKSPKVKTTKKVRLTMKIGALNRVALDSGTNPS